MLPDGADQDDVNATYDRGILTVSVPLSDETGWRSSSRSWRSSAYEDEDDGADDAPGRTL